MNNQPVIQAENVFKSYGRQAVLKGANLTVNRGNVYALLGNNGVGKTTLIKLIAGQLQPDGGRVAVFGLDPIADGVAIRARTAYVAELMKVFDWMTLDDLIRFVKSFYPKWNDERCRRMRRNFDLPADVKLNRFSRGMYAKAVLLAAFCREPELLILDDPCLGLDTGSRLDFMAMLIDSLENYDQTVLISTHIIPEIAGVVDRVGIIADGTVALEADAAELRRDYRLLTLPAAAEAQLPPLDVLRRTESGAELMLAVRGDEADTAARLRETGVTAFELRPLSLEELFLARTGRIEPADERSA
jgi:ABC-2 type transport system ATP-binding protein